MKRCVHKSCLFIFASTLLAPTLSLHRLVAGPEEPLMNLSLFTPPDDLNFILVKGSTVPFKAAIMLLPSSVDAMYYAGELIVNGKKYGRPFEFKLLPKGPGSSAGGMETMTWYVHVTGPRTMTVQLHLSAHGFVTQKSFEYRTQVYGFKLRCNPKHCALIRFFEELFQGCW